MLSPISPASFGLLSLRLFRFILYSWCLLQWLRLQLSLPFQCFWWRSGVWTSICTFIIPMGKNFYIIRVEQLFRIDHSNIRYIQVWAIMLDSNNYSLQSFDGFTLSVISFYGIYFFRINVNNLIITSILRFIKVSAIATLMDDLNILEFPIIKWPHSVDSFVASWV